MRRKLLLVNVLIVLMLLFSACGPKATPEPTAAPDDTTEETPEPEPTLEPVELTWYVIGNGTPPEKDLVMDAINELPAMKAINAKIDIVWYDWGSYNQKTQLMFAGGEECDITFASSWTNNYTNGSIEGNFVALDDLLPEYAPKLYAQIPPRVWNMVRVGGNIYGVPIEQLWYTTWGPTIRKDYADKYDLNYESIIDYKDFEPFMQRILDAEPELENKIWAKPGGITHAETYNYEGTGFGVIKKGDESRTIVDWIATEGYRTGVELMYRWHGMGFTPNEIITSDEVHTARLAGFYPIWDHVTKPGITSEEENKFGWEYVTKSMQYNPSLSYILPGLNSVCATSKNPERALMFIELVHTDEAVYNTVAKGIEGTHWVWVDEDRKIIGKPEGLDSETSGYAPNTDWEFGKQFLAYYINEGQVGAWEETMKVNDSSPLPMYGPWTFDATPVEAEVAAVSTVDEIFGGLLQWGLVDPDDPEAGIDAYIQARKDAGIDVILEESNKQLQQFVADNPEIFSE